MHAHLKDLEVDRKLLGHDGFLHVKPAFACGGDCVVHLGRTKSTRAQTGTFFAWRAKVYRGSAAASQRTVVLSG